MAVAILTDNDNDSDNDGNPAQHSPHQARLIGV